MGSSPLIWPEEGPLWWGRDGGRSVCRWENHSCIRILTEALRMFLPSPLLHFESRIFFFFFFLKTAHTFRASRMPHTPRVNLSVPCAQSLPPFRTLLLYRAGGTEAAVAHDKSKAWNSIRKGSAQDFTAFTEENSFWYIGTPIYSPSRHCSH